VLTFRVLAGLVLVRVPALLLGFLTSLPGVLKSGDLMYLAVRGTAVLLPAAGGLLLWGLAGWLADGILAGDERVPVGRTGVSEWSLGIGTAAFAVVGLLALHGVLEPLCRVAWTVTLAARAWSNDHARDSMNAAAAQMGGCTVRIIMGLALLFWPRRLAWALLRPREGRRDRPTRM
jgi:hypothetical protein